MKLETLLYLLENHKYIDSNEVDTLFRNLYYNDDTYNHPLKDLYKLYIKDLSEDQIEDLWLFNLTPLEKMSIILNLFKFIDRDLKRFERRFDKRDLLIHDFTLLNRFIYILEPFIDKLEINEKLFKGCINDTFPLLRRIYFYKLLRYRMTEAIESIENSK